MRLMIFIALALHAASSPIALAVDDSNFYVGVGVGGAYITEDRFFISDTSTVYKLFGGYQFNTHIALEAALVDFDDVAEFIVINTLEQRAVADGQGINSAVVFRAPLTERFSFSGKAGLFYWDAETNSNNIANSDNGTDLFVGVGFGFQIRDNLAIQFEYERYEFGDIEADVGSIALRITL